MCLLKTLHPDLLPHLHSNSWGGLYLDHPLIGFLHDDEFDSANEEYESTRQKLDTYAQRKDWLKYLCLHDQEHWHVPLLMLARTREIDSRKFWKLVAAVWARSLCSSENLEEWTEIWASAIPDRHCSMNPTERAAFDALPDTITVWRGITSMEHYYEELSCNSLAWTTKKEGAVGWAEERQYGSRLICRGYSSLVVTGTVSKSNALSYLHRRETPELIVMPDVVDVVNVEEVWSNPAVAA